MMPLSLIPLLGLILSPAALADDKALDKLQGSWNVVRYVNDGTEETPPADKPETLVIKGGRFELKRSQENLHGELKVDASSTPWQIDATYFDADDKKLGEAEGIYRFEGQKLIMVWAEAGGKRPKNFSSDSGSKVRMITLEKKD